MEEEYDLTKVEHPELIDFMNDLLKVNELIKVDETDKEIETHYAGTNPLD